MLPIKTNPPLKPGVLRHQIAWRRKVVTGQNGFGEDDFTWQLVVLVKAQVRPAGGREREAMGQRWAEAEHVVRQHYVPGMDRAERGDWTVDGVMHYLDILDVQDEGGLGRTQLIAAKEWLA
jgi:head-tail adaptor